MSLSLVARRELKRGLVDAIPIMISFIPFSLVLGAQAIQERDGNR